MKKLLALVAPENFSHELTREIELSAKQCSSASKMVARHENLFLVETSQLDWTWSQNTWFDVETFKFNSISEAAKILNGKAPMWALHGIQNHRRAELIQKQLAHFKAKPIVFPTVKKLPPLGAWGLVDANTLICSPRTSSPFADGAIEFVENKTEAPSRAYLKLWEFFTRRLASRKSDSEVLLPGRGSICMDLGSAPGGWTWVLHNLGCEVISVDRAALDDRLAVQKNIKHLRQDAFSVKPEDVGPIDWLFSDLICYPPKLFELVEKWRHSDLVRNFVCTIKFQKETDFETVAKFKKIHNSHILHLSHNKHEVTWYSLGN